jgi:hypothetical protein
MPQIEKSHRENSPRRLVGPHDERQRMPPHLPHRGRPDTVERTLDRRHLDEAELGAWLASLNAIRLVVGTRLGVTETSSEEDFAGDEQSAELFELYRYMTWLEGWVIEALDQELASGEPDGRGRPS